MRPSSIDGTPLSTPELLGMSEVLIEYLQTLSVVATQKLMKVSEKLATEVVAMHQDLTKTHVTTPAITTFQGDVYAQLNAAGWSNEDLNYANHHLRIISGLYGVLRPLDGILPYRLELGYPAQVVGHKNLFEFWGSRIADSLPRQRPIINLLSEEYYRAIKPHVHNDVISPQFLTQRPSDEQPRAIAIHAKQARGSLARWLIQQRVSSYAHITQYAELGYTYSTERSTQLRPVFIKKQN